MSTRREFLKNASTIGLGAVSTSAAIAFPAARAKVSKSNGRINAVNLRAETIRRLGGNGDNWHMTWAADDRQYVSLCDGVGFSPQPKVTYNSRILTISGGPHDAKFDDLVGYPMLGAPHQGIRETRYYGFGTLAMGDYLYQFMSTFNRPLTGDEVDNKDVTNALRFNGAKLIYSSDKGRTWRNQDGSTPVVWESWERRSRRNLVFFSENQDAFSLLTVLQMGKDYEHNTDGYVYVYSPNGSTEGTMNELVMFRVPKAKLLERSAYQFFAGTRGGSVAMWAKDINDRKPVHVFPRGWVNNLVHPFAWQPSVVYNAALDVYMMTSWGMGTASDGTWFSKPSYLGIWVGRTPWGPWTQIYEDETWRPSGDTKARAYQPQIAPKWIAPDGKSFWLVWTDFQGGDNPVLRQAGVAYNRKAVEGTLTSADVQSYASNMRKYMPYYAFNVQRVDLSIT